MRLFFLDNLKTFVVNLMIVFHVGLCYIAGPLPWWYVLDPDLRVEMTYWILVTDMTIMPMMFYISGYFGIRSIAKKAGADFWKARWLRIGIPWLAGIVIFAPLVSFIMPYSRGLTDDFNTYLWNYYFFNPATGGMGEFFNHVPYWYLGVLMVLYAGLYLFCRLRKSYARQLPAADSPQWWFFLLIGLFIFVNSVVINMITGNEYLWVPIGYLFVIQPSRILLYVLFFWLGAYSWKHRWFEQNGYVPSAEKWTAPFIFSAILLPWSFCHSMSYVNNDPLQFLLLISLAHALLLTTAVFGWLGIFHKLFNHTNKIWGELAANSYTMYYCHIWFIFLPVLCLVPYSISPFLKWFVACAVGWPITYMCSKVLLKLPFFAAGKRAKLNN